MKNLKRNLIVSACIALSIFGFVEPAAAQDRPRVATTVSSRPINQPPAAPATTQPSSTTRTVSQRPTLTNEINVAPPASLVKKTADIKPLNVGAIVARRSIYTTVVTNNMMGAIQKRLGIPYLYGSEGPNRYDCSGFVWAVFGDAGMKFDRTSARSLWEMSVPVEGEERYRFGTLVFMNKLGHMGIVADENGFYHASSSKGITYSPFKGYWEKRIVGFRRLVVPSTETAPAAAPAEEAKAAK
ncbi:MAG: C40 family peptidase [Pyrinomonadaceae bacterium]|nr:C40 family peptidase [Pyrinomonadaceae bacterium]